jgi:hypothetical protein
MNDIDGDFVTYLCISASPIVVFIVVVVFVVLLGA